MTTADTSVLTTVVAPRRSVYGHLTQIWVYRELLGNLVRKELKVKYKNSVLGFCWSLLNPLMYLAVFFIVFEGILGAGVDYFAEFLLTGLLTSIVLGFQRSLYGLVVSSDSDLVLPQVSQWWYFRNLAIVGAASAILLALAISYFGRVEANFAEEL